MWNQAHTDLYSHSCTKRWYKSMHIETLAQSHHTDKHILFVRLALSVYPPAYLSAYLPTCLCVCLSVSDSLSLSLFLSLSLLCLSVSQSVCLSVCVCLCLSVCLSVSHVLTAIYPPFRLPKFSWVCRAVYC